MEPNLRGNGGLKNAVDSVGPRMKKKLWVGTLGTCTDTYGEELRKDIDKRMLEQRDSLLVWIPDAEFQSCYDEFCHQVLWPCLHYAVPDAPKTKNFYESASYKQYVAVNQRFADAIISQFKEGDIIWVNDYHLLLLPLLLRLSPQIPPSTPIGFFMHVAFPSSEIFRCLSVRKDLLRGMLGADVVGFQTASYARHWRQTVSRILSYEALPRGIQIPEGEGLTVEEARAKEKGETNEKARVRDGLGERGRFVDVGVFPMGIDVHQLRGKMQEPDVDEWVQVLQQRYAGMKLVVGRDKLDEVQGVKQKLLAFEAFLLKYPAFQGKVVLIQVALQTTESNELAAGGVADVVSRINGRFSNLTYQPVVFLHTQDLTFSQYLALLKVADAFIVTSLREGMALRTHEFVECQEGRYRPLILSEFAGSYSYSGFRSCIVINPWDTRGTANAIHQALTMPNDEARSRWEDLHNHVTTQTAQAFVTTFLNRCVRSNAEHTASLMDDSSGGGVSLSVTGQAIPHLGSQMLISKFKHSSKRLILVDFEGTLWRRDLTKNGLIEMSKLTESLETSNVEGKLPNEVEDTIEVIGKLAENWKNEVWLLSGLRVKGVLESIAERVPRVGIVAENGCFVKLRDINSGGADAGTTGGGGWISMVSSLNMTWKSPCLEILNYFSERTPGSCIEEREASMIWRFWTGETMDHPDRQWAKRQAAEAQNHIFDSLGERYGLRIIPGRNSFLVMPNNISRSTAVAAILQQRQLMNTGPAIVGGGSLATRRKWTANLGLSNSNIPLISRSFSEGFGYGFGLGPGLPVPGRTNLIDGFGNVAGAAGDVVLNSTARALGTIGLGDAGASGAGSEDEIDFLLAISSDEKLLTRLNEIDGAETVSTSGKGTDGKWRLEGEEVVGVLKALQVAGERGNGDRVVWI